MKKKSQIERVESWLRRGRSIMPLQALREFGSLRLGALIWVLRQNGMPITTEYVKTGKRTCVAKYRLLKESQNETRNKIQKQAKR